MMQILRRQVENDCDATSSEGASTLSLEQALVRRLYAARGFIPKDDQAYSLRYLERPAALRGLAAALTLLERALSSQSRVLVVGDFDADGATSTALAIRCLRTFGFAHIDFLVPNRFEFGYGLTPEIVALAAQSEPELIITVDNGISSVSGVAAAKALGMAVLITDHHLPGNELPAADAIVNPNQYDCPFPSKNLAGVGVIFYLMSAFRSLLREKNWFEKEGIEEPNLANYLDLVALGTVADLVPLDYNNRILVDQGLQRIRSGKCCVGLSALIEVGGRDRCKLSVTDFGFVLGPRLNAAGRLDDMSVGIRLLLSDDENEALEIARELDGLNRDRRSIEAGMKTEALAILEKSGLDLDGDNKRGVCLYKEDWHEGVIGILASRIKERLYRPTIVFAQTSSGTLKGSGRSVPGVHLRDVLDDVASQHPDMLSKFGGHAMAAGLTLELEHLPQFELAFDEAVRQRLLREQGSDELSQTLHSDGELMDTEMSLSTAWAIRHAGPWGQAFPEPCFDGVFRLLQQRIVGQKHLKLVVSPKAHPSLVMDAIAFNVDVDIWPNHSAQYVHLLYKLDVNEYRGQESLQLIVDHLTPAH